MLVDCFLETAGRYPDKLAIKDPSRHLTFSQLLNFAQTIRRLVQSQTDCPRVGIMLPTTCAGVGTILGTLWAGRTFVPLNFLLQPVELARIVEDAGLDLIVSTVHFEPLLKHMTVKVLYLEQLGLKRRYLFTKLQRTAPSPGGQPDDVAALVYTSATTGDSKGVCLTHRNFEANSASIVEHVRIAPDDCLLGVLPNFHVFGLTLLNFVPAIFGTTVSCIPRFVATDVQKAIDADHITVLIAVPSMYAALARLKHLDPAEFAHVRIAASGGEPLSRPVYDEMLERTGVRIVEGYGMTETSPIISCDLPWEHRVGTVGPALPGVELQLRDAEGNLLDRSQEGELYVRGELVMQGYYNRPTETAAVLSSDGWLRTGDIVRLDDRGYVRITGRAKDLIIVGGENVYPREIEDVLDRHPAVAESAVIGRSDHLRGEAVVGFVTLREGCVANSTDLRAHCRQNLAGFKVPREIFIRTDLPRSPTGKILKRALPDILKESA